MGFTRRTLVADCEISTGMLNVSQLPPIFVGEAGALDVNVTLKLNGQAYTPTGVTASMHLYWPGTTLQTEYVQMTVNGNVISGRFTNLLTALPGSPLLIIRIKEASTDDIIVATATPVRIWQTRGDNIVSPTPSPKSNVKTVDGQEPDQFGNVALYDSHIPSSVITGQDTVALALAYLNTYKANAADVYTKQEVYNKLEVYNKTEIETLISTLFRYKGNKATYADIQAITTKAIGDVWFCLADSSEYAWDGSKWEKLGPIIDLSAYLTQFSIAGLTIDADHATITAAQLRTALDIYTKSEVDTALAAKANQATTYTKTEVDTALETKANQATTYTKTEVDTALATKANQATTYTKTEVDTALDLKANQATTYTKTEVDEKVKHSEVTVTGNPATFETDSEQLAKRAVLTFEPIQDLHGYDAPWPAGGGKNLCPVGTITFTRYRRESVSLPAGTYTISALITSSGTDTNVSRVYFRNSNASEIIAISLGRNVRSSGTVTLSEECVYCDFHAETSGTTSNEDTATWADIQIESGSTATDYAPYSNICPISGRTEAEVTRTGKNLLNPEGNDQSGKVNNGITFTVNSDGTITCNGTATAQARYYFENNLTFDRNVIYTCEGAVSGEIACYAGGQNVFEDNPRTFTAGNSLGANFLYVADGKTMSNYIVKPMIRLADVTDGTFEPYQSQSISITFPAEAGTVYGGTLTIENDGSGTLVVNMASVDLGTLSWGYASSETRFYARVSGIKDYNYTELANIFCEKYRTHIWNGTKNGDIFSAHNYVSVKDRAYTDVATFTSAVSGVMLVYELATPITYQLADLEVIELLKGTNNVFTDAKTLSLTFTEGELATLDQMVAVNNRFIAVDNRLDEHDEQINELDNAIATPKITGTTNNTGSIIAKDTFFWLNGTLCQTLLDVASNATFTLNTNYRVVSEGGLNTVLNRISNVVYPNAGSHNAIYRGKFLGTSVTAEQWAQIKAGTFEDMYIGDYWTINGVNWRIAAFDYWLNIGNLSAHHVVIVPDTCLTSAKMNNTDTTAGAYYNSDFRTGRNNNTGRATAITAVNNAFGSAHILTYQDYLHSAVTDGHPSGQEWANCTVELMNEEMVYGAHIFAPIANGTEIYANTTTSKSQLPLFQHEHSRITNYDNWWLRSVVSASTFSRARSVGDASYRDASTVYGVRPAFGIFQPD